MLLTFNSSLPDTSTVYCRSLTIAHFLKDTSNYWQHTSVERSDSMYNSEI